MTRTEELIASSQAGDEKAKELCGDSAGLRELYTFWVPAMRIDYEDCKDLFRRIDKELS